MGIEPTYPAWKAGVLPLNYTRMENGNYLSVTTLVILHAKTGIVNSFFIIFKYFFNIHISPLSVPDRKSVV